MSHRLYSCSDGVDMYDGGVCVLVWAKSERYARKQMALENARNGGDYDLNSQEFDITDVTDRIPAELHRTVSCTDGRSKVQRLAGWRIEGDDECCNCTLWSWNGDFPVCDVCERCSECGHDSECENGEEE